MSYDFSYKGAFEFADAAALAAAFAAFDEAAASYEKAGEGSVMSRDDLVVGKLKITIDESGSMPASMFYGTDAVIRALAEHAFKGSVEAVSNELKERKTFRAEAKPPKQAVEEPTRKIAKKSAKKAAKKKSAK